MRPLMVVFFVLSLIASSLAHAHADFYASSVAVEDRSTEVLRLGLREALVQVLSKASGMPVELIKQRSSLAQELNYGDKLASQFAYHSKKVQIDGKWQQKLYLKASFPESKVVSLLQKGGLTFWAPERPALHLLVMEKRGSQTDWFADEYDVLKELQNQAVLHWGFEIEQQTVELEPARLWYADEALLAQGNKPLLVIRLRPSDSGQVNGSANLVNLELSQFFRADNEEQWFQQAIAWAAGQLSAKYAVQLLSRDSEVMLRFSDVNDYQQYQEVLSAIEALDIVQHVYVLGLDANTLRLAVSYTTQLEQLQYQLLQNTSIHLANDAVMSNYQLDLRWQSQ